ncbi:gamma-glutamylcyclotransferase [Vibrio profundum]|uniref:gamma-glutamylcyclotransferase family protein n=1 Tax=Vibrio profundum TaxID=2910247 RepID=UPI003D12B5D9
MLHQVWVYGSLRRGELNHHYLEDAKYLGTYSTPACYTLYDLGEYPALVPDGETSVIGEVYAVNEKTLGKLDELEEVPIEFRRETIETIYGKVWVYLYQQNQQSSQGKKDRLLREVSSGNWCCRKKR